MHCARNHALSQLIPLQDQTAGTLVGTFEEGWNFRGRGVPKSLLTDRAHNIDGTEIRSICAQLLMTGRQLASPIAATIANPQWADRPGHADHVEKLKEFLTQLQPLASENHLNARPRERGQKLRNSKRETQC